MTDSRIDREELLDLWIEMLESGEYEQCYKKLRHGDAFCANGLLVEAIRLLGGDVEWLGDFCRMNRMVSSGFPDFPEYLNLLDVGAKAWKLNDMNERTLPEIGAYFREHRSEFPEARSAPWEC